MDMYHPKKNDKLLLKSVRGVNYKLDQSGAELMVTKKSHLFTNACIKESVAPSRVEKHAAFSTGITGARRNTPHNNKDAYSRFTESYNTSNKVNAYTKRSLETSQEKFLTRHPIGVSKQSNYYQNGPHFRGKDLEQSRYYTPSSFSRSSSDCESNQEYVPNLLRRYQDPTSAPIQHDPITGSLPRKFVKHEDTMPKFWARIRALAKPQWLTKLKENDFSRCKCGKPCRYASAIDLVSQHSGVGSNKTFKTQYSFASSYSSESSREDDSAVDVDSNSKRSKKGRSLQDYDRKHNLLISEDEKGKLKRFASSPALVERTIIKEVGSTTDSDVDSGIVKHSQSWMPDLSNTSTTTSASESEYESEHKRSRIRFKTSRADKHRRRGPIKADHSIPLVIKNKRLKEPHESPRLDFQNKENLHHYFPEISRYKHSCHYHPLSLTFEDDLFLYRQIIKHKLMEQTKCICGIPWKNPEQQPFQKCQCGRYSFGDPYDYPSNWPSPDELYAYIRAFPSMLQTMSSEDGSDSSVYNADQSSMSSVSSSQNVRPTILPDKPKTVETQTSPTYLENENLINKNNNYKIGSTHPLSNRISEHYPSVSSQGTELSINLEDYLQEAFDDDDDEDSKNKTLKNSRSIYDTPASSFVYQKNSDNRSLTSGHGESCYDSIRSEGGSTSSRSTLMSKYTSKSEPVTQTKLDVTNTYSKPTIRVTPETEDSGHYTSVSDCTALEPVLTSTPQCKEDEVYTSIDGNRVTNSQEWEALDKLDSVLNRASWHSSMETITDEISDNVKKKRESTDSSVLTYAKVNPIKKRSLSLLNIKDRAVSNPCITTINADEEITELGSEPPLPPRRYRSSDLEKYKDIGESRTFMAKIQNKFNEVRKAMSLDRLDKRSKADKPQKTKIKKMTTFKMLFGKKTDKEDKKEKDGSSQYLGMSNNEEPSLIETTDEKMNKKTSVQTMGNVLNINSDGIKLIHLVRPAKGPFGFYIAKGTSKFKNGIFVSRMKSSTYSRMLSGLLGIGDEILEINEITVREKNLQQVYELMINKNELQLKVLPYISRKTD